MIWAQVISIVFALLAALISAGIVTRFETYGATIRQMTLLHRYTFIAKALFCGVITAIQLPSIRVSAFSALLAALWIYLLFDIALNRLRHPKRPWDYLGLNDGDGRFWNGLFGQSSGKIKAAVILSAIIAINILCQL